MKLVYSVLYGYFCHQGAAGDPGNMRMVQAASFAVNSTPFEGNYPTGVFTSNATGSDIVYYGE